MQSQLVKEHTGDSILSKLYKELLCTMSLGISLSFSISLRFSIQLHPSILYLLALERSVNCSSLSSSTNQDSNINELQHVQQAQVFWYNLVLLSFRFGTFHSRLCSRKHYINFGIYKPFYKRCQYYGHRPQLLISCSYGCIFLETIVYAFSSNFEHRLDEIIYRLFVFIKVRRILRNLMIYQLEQMVVVS